MIEQNLEIWSCDNCGWEGLSKNKFEAYRNHKLYWENLHSGEDKFVCLGEVNKGTYLDNVNK